MSQGQTSPLSPPTLPSPTKIPTKPSSKKNFQYLWKGLCILVTIIMLILIHKIYLFHTLQYFHHHKKGQISTLLIYSLPFCLLFIALEHYMHKFFDQYAEKNYLRTDRYPKMQQRMRKAFSIVKWQYSNIYYTCTSITAYILIKDTKFMPWFWGGNGSAYTLQQTRYLEQATLGMQVYYSIQFGKHVGRLFSHVFIRPEGAYFEYLLHHSLSVFLIAFSYLMDMWVIGIFVFFLHDVSDVFLGHCRSYREYKSRNNSILNFSYVMVLLSWVGCRIISMFYIVYAIAYQCIFRIGILNAAEYQVFYFPYVFMGFMLCCLLLMHVYWLYYIFQSFLGTASKEQKAKHTYD